MLSEKAIRLLFTKVPVGIFGHSANASFLVRWQVTDESRQPFSIRTPSSCFGDIHSNRGIESFFVHVHLLSVETILVWCFICIIRCVIIFPPVPGQGTRYPNQQSYIPGAQSIDVCVIRKDPLH